MIFPGFVSPKELRGLYELATALVFPSRFEGWGLPVCEAFSAGLPVASSAATGLPDLVGDAGLLFDPTAPSRSPMPCSGSGPTRPCAATSPHEAKAQRALQLGAHRAPLPRSLPADRRAELCRRRPYPSGGPASRLNAGLFADVDTGSSDKGAVSVLQRAIAGVLAALRRVLGTINQVVFRDRLRHIDQQTERLGSASVEAVTHLGGEVRALDQRLAAIERELAALRELLERRERSSDEDDEPLAARPHAG